MLKRLAKRAAAKFGKHQWKPHEARLQILAYHRVLPMGDARYRLEQPGMCVTPEVFEKNIIWLKNNFEIVRLASWLKADDLPAKNFCALTFDDGWLDNFEFALPIIQKHEVPITLYCVSGLIENTGEFWPGRLTNLLNYLVSRDKWGADSINSHFGWLLDILREKSWALEKPINRDNLDAIIEACKSYTDADINGYIDATILDMNVQIDPERVLLNVFELKEMISTGLVDIGSHSKNHTRLNRIANQEELEIEIVSSKLELQSLLGVEIETFCYPNGRVTKEAAELVLKNYLAGCALTRGWNTIGSDRARLNRLNVHQGIAEHQVEFLSRLSGWF